MLSALRRLPLDDQLLLQMHYWDGLTGPALSRALDLPEGTVRSRLRRAKAKLAERLTIGV
jgi:RNA polymerase sigma-70 factor (ECF subfamily)